jgi:hypothetical protein
MNWAMDLLQAGKSGSLRWKQLAPQLVTWPLQKRMISHLNPPRGCLFLWTLRAAFAFDGVDAGGLV